MAASCVVRIMLVEVQRSGEPVLVDQVCDDFVLDLIRESEVQVREADRRRLRYARHWAAPGVRRRHSRPPRLAEPTFQRHETKSPDAGEAITDLEWARWARTTETGE